MIDDLAHHWILISIPKDSGRPGDFEPAQSLSRVSSYLGDSSSDRTRTQSWYKKYPIMGIQTG